MSNKKPLPTAITALISALMSMSDSSTVLRVEPREGESMDDAIARTEAEHRETCAECRADYEAEQQAKTASQDMAKGTDPTLIDEMCKKLYAKHKEELDLLEKKHADECATLARNMGTRKVGASPVFGASYGEQPERTPIGFMVFAMSAGKMRPIPSSFSEDREQLEASLTEFNKNSRMSLGEVRPIYAA